MSVFSHFCVPGLNFELFLYGMFLETDCCRMYTNIGLCGLWNLPSDITHAEIFVFLSNLQNHE